MDLLQSVFLCFWRNTGCFYSFLPHTFTQLSGVLSVTWQIHFKHPAINDCLEKFTKSKDL